MASPLTLSALAAGSLLLLPAGSATAADAPSPDTELEPVLITAQRTERISRGATGLDLDVKDTPQSISVVSADLMQAFGADSLNEALRLATGIQVEEWETNRTNYLARGFEIKNTQIDGVGLPNDWGIVTGAMDSFGYEKLEVIRGANGLLTGVGNASGTINYVRKRPTNQREGQLNVSAGSWDTRRVEGDFSTPLTANESWAARVVGAYDEGHSYLRGLQNQRHYFYGTVDGQIGERATLALGYSLQHADTDGNMWGALVLANNDGTQAQFPRSSSPTQDWTYWNTRNQSAFVELTYLLAAGWTLKGTYNYRESSEDDKLFFVSTSTGLDPVTGEGLVGWPGRYAGSGHSHLADLSLAGRFTALGREHELMLGVSQAHSVAQLDFWEAPASSPAFGPLPPFPYAGDAVPEPLWGPRQDYDHMGQWMQRAYGASRLALTDRVKAVAGFNLVRFHRQGINSYGEFHTQTENELSPYAGLTVDVTANLLAYASYSDIYQPQDQYDIDEHYLAPSKGKNYEIGVKAGWLDQRLLTTLALFRADQTNLATFAGLNGNGNYYYEGVDVRSEGVELEVAGRLGRGTEVILGFTSLQLEGEDGDAMYTWVPRRTANLSLLGALPGLPALRLGIHGRWQSRISKVDSYTGVVIRQQAYATVNLSGEWKFSERASVRAQVNNIGNEKFIGSLYEVGFYGAPRHYTLGASYRF